MILGYFGSLKEGHIPHAKNFVTCTGSEKPLEASKKENDMIWSCYGELTPTEGENELAQVEKALQFSSSQIRKAQD